MTTQLTTSILKPSKNDIIRKSNKFNVLTPYRSVIQLKLLSLFITEVINKPDQEDNKYKVKVADVLKKFDIDRKNIKRTKKLAKDMMRAIDLDPENKTGFDLEVLFTKIKTTSNEYWEFEINNNFKPYLLNIKDSYTKYFLNNVSKISMKHTFRMYEILKQYEKTGWLCVDVAKLKKMLDISANKYPSYRTLKGDVILPAQKEMKEKTDIQFTFTEIKEKLPVGRPKVVSLKFHIIKNKKSTIKSNQSKEAPHNDFNQKENLKYKSETPDQNGIPKEYQGTEKEAFYTVMIEDLCLSESQTKRIQGSDMSQSEFSKQVIL